MLTELPLERLKLDWNLYPRHEVDSQHVTRLIEALHAGSQLPPMIADRQTKRIVDGFHRYRAYQRLLEPGQKVAVEMRNYRSEAALFEEAMRVNARHGIPFDPIDQVHCYLRGQELGLSLESLADAMAVPATKLQSIVLRRLGESAKGDKVILKPALTHLQGKPLTRPQVAVNDRLTGNSAEYYLRLVVEMLEAGCFDFGNERILALIRRLQDALAGVCVTA
jgi:hypothetical protein